MDYRECCGRYHAGSDEAPTPEALLRSRYTAYVLDQVDYLLATWHPTTRPKRDILSPVSGASLTWLGLDIKWCRQTSADTAEAQFIARYRIGGGSAVRLQEHSRFICDDGRWYYQDAL